MTTSIVAATFFAGNMETARIFLKEQGYMPNMLGKSRLNCRQHRIADLFLTMFNLLSTLRKHLNDQSIYILVCFPVAASENYRIPRSRRYMREDCRGNQASKKRYFYGLKLHLMFTGNGQPVEFFLTLGSRVTPKLSI